MAFRVGQKVVCVDDSPAANPWHRQHPLVLKQIYIVHALMGPNCIAVDGSGRAWQRWRFRPVVDRKQSTETGMSILRGLLKTKKIPETMASHHSERAISTHAAEQGA